MNTKRLLISLGIALFLLLAPILPYKSQLSKCQAEGLETNQPYICNSTYIPFQQGFPMKFYHEFCPGFCLYNSSPWFVSQPFPHSEGGYNETRIPWYIYFIADLAVLSSIIYIASTFLSKQASKK